MNNLVNLIGVEIGGKFYISIYNPNNSYSPYSGLSNYKINGKILSPSFNPYWYISDEPPTLLEVKQPAAYINHRYELKDETLKSDKIPLVIKYEEIEEEDGVWYGRYNNLESLYKLCCDTTEEKYEPVEFSYQTVLSVEDIKCPETAVFTKNIQFSSVAKMLYPPIVLPNTICELTAEESYKIVREYIKLNIDPKYAEITSDYDFCFTVKKKIQLSEEEKYTIDVNSFSLGRKKKPKYETRYRTHKSITCFEIAPKPYHDYTVIKPFRANNQKELEEQINKYLKDLIKKINEPIKYCKCCKGTGVIVDEN